MSENKDLKLDRLKTHLAVRARNYRIFTKRNRYLAPRLNKTIEDRPKIKIKDHSIFFYNHKSREIILNETPNLLKDSVKKSLNIPNKRNTQIAPNSLIKSFVNEILNPTYYTKPNERISTNELRFNKSMKMFEKNINLKKLKKIIRNTYKDKIIPQKENQPTKTLMKDHSKYSYYKIDRKSVV